MLSVFDSDLGLYIPQVLDTFKWTELKFIEALCIRLLLFFLCTKFIFLSALYINQFPYAKLFILIRKS